MSGICAKYHVQFMLLLVYTITWEIQSSNGMCLFSLRWFRFVEKIGFEVLVFSLAGPDIEPGLVLFSVSWFSKFSFGSWISWFQNLEIFPPFLLNLCDKIIWWFWVTIVTVIFTHRYFKLSWNTSALSQSNARNFSGSSIIIFIII